VHRRRTGSETTAGKIEGSGDLPDRDVNRREHLLEKMLRGVEGWIFYRLLDLGDLCREILKEMVGFIWFISLESFSYLGWLAHWILSSDGWSRLVSDCFLWWQMIHEEKEKLQ